jgi:hypothetical protein
MVLLFELVLVLLCSMIVSHAPVIPVVAQIVTRRALSAATIIALCAMNVAFVIKNVSITCHADLDRPEPFGVPHINHYSLAFLTPAFAALQASA